METNQNRSSQTQGNSNSSNFSSGSSNASQGSSTGSNQKSSSSMGGMNMGNLTQQLQKYSGPIMNKVNSLSTTQKVVGGTLLAAGAGWLAMNSRNKKKGINSMNRTTKKKY